MESLAGAHIKSAMQYTRESVVDLVALASKLEDLDRRHAIPQVLVGRVMSTLFFENSSRTYCSFVAAMQKLGGSVVTLPIESSSMATKGESFSDTIHTVDAYSDVIVLRHPSVSAIDDAVVAAKHPVLNAGNGAGEHPTQALLDVTTIHAEIGRLDNINIVFVGDLKYGRTVHSLVKLLDLFSEVTMTFVAHDSLQIPEGVTAGLRSTSKQVHELLPEVVAAADIIYVTRVQKERFASTEEYEKVKSAVQVNAETLRSAKEKMAVLHPLPRNDELTQDVDHDPRAAYFRQMRHGLFARMALLCAVLGVTSKI